MKKFILLTFSLALILTSCRHGEVGFTMDQQKVFLGESINVYNSSYEYDHFRWSVDDPYAKYEEKEWSPGPIIISAPGTYTIGLDASYNRGMRNPAHYEKTVNVTSWTLNKLVINKLPLNQQWDNNSGPDLVLKINEPQTTFWDLFGAEHSISLPGNVTYLDLPIVVEDFEIQAIYSSWVFSLEDQDFPLPNQLMRSWTVNPYLNEEAGVIKIGDNDYELEFYYSVNN